LPAGQTRDFNLKIDTAVLRAALAVVIIGRAADAVDGSTPAFVPAEDRQRAVRIGLASHDGRKHHDH